MLSRILKLFTKPSLTGITLFLLLFPASNNYRLDGFQFGGGEFDQSSTNYQMHSVLGESNEKMKSGNYGLNSGLKFVQMADTPAVPTLTNDENWTNQLKIVINPGSNPTDATFAIAISSDNWATTQWVQSDTNTPGNTLGIEDFQTYAAWGGINGDYIIGLSSNTDYNVKVKASQGKYTEGPLGPEASNSTSELTSVFDIDIASSNTETDPPYSLSFGELTLGSVATATNQIWLDLTSNASLGAYVYVYGTNGGLKSASTNYTISSSSTDLTSATEGFGIRNNSATLTETSGGPFAALSPYNSTGDTVGVVDSSIRELLNTSGNSISGGRASLYVKAKAGTLTSAATDYVEVITLIAAGTF